MRAVLIDSYTRADAIADGVLFDVTKMAKEAGFAWPVAITTNLQAVLNDIPMEYRCQDYEGRLWDVLFMGVLNIRMGFNGDELQYEIICHHHSNGSKSSVREELKLKMVAHAGDDMEPVITIDRL